MRAGLIVFGIIVPVLIRSIAPRQADSLRLSTAGDT